MEWVVVKGYRPKEIIEETGRCVIMVKDRLNYFYHEQQQQNYSRQL